jgi:hypothetical protein
MPCWCAIVLLVHCGVCVQLLGSEHKRHRRQLYLLSGILARPSSSPLLRLARGGEELARSRLSHVARRLVWWIGQLQCCAGPSIDVGDCIQCWFPVRDVGALGSPLQPPSGRWTRRCLAALKWLFLYLTTVGPRRWLCIGRRGSLVSRGKCVLFSQRANGDNDGAAHSSHPKSFCVLHETRLYCIA